MRLSEEQIAEVQALEGRAKLTEYERGMIAAFRRATQDPVEARRLERLLEK